MRNNLFFGLGHEFYISSGQVKALELEVEYYLRSGTWLRCWTSGYAQYMETLRSEQPTAASDLAKKLARQAVAPVEAELSAATIKGRQAAWMGWLDELAGQVRYYRDHPVFTLTITEGERDKRNREYGTLHVQLDVEWEEDDGPLTYGWRASASWSAQSYRGQLHGSLSPKRDNMLEVIFTLVQDQRETGQSTITGGREFVRACLEVMGERQLVEKAGRGGSSTQF